MLETIITRQRKCEAEQAISDLQKRGFELTFPLTEFSRDGKIFDRDSYNRHTFAGNSYSSVWKAKLRKVDN